MKVDGGGAFRKRELTKYSGHSGRLGRPEESRPSAAVNVVYRLRNAEGVWKVIEGYHDVNGEAETAFSWLAPGATGVYVTTTFRARGASGSHPAALRCVTSGMKPGAGVDVGGFVAGVVRAGVTCAAKGVAGASGTAEVDLRYERGTNATSIVAARQKGDVLVSVEP
jgi:hypothetical protein